MKGIHRDRWSKGVSARKAPGTFFTQNNVRGSKICRSPNPVTNVESRESRVGSGGLSAPTRPGVAPRPKLKRTRSLQSWRVFHLEKKRWKALREFVRGSSVSLFVVRPFGNRTAILRNLGNLNIPDFGEFEANFHDIWRMFSNKNQIS